MVVAVGLTMAMPSLAQKTGPTFGQFPVAGHFAGHPAPLRLRHQQDREFRTELASAANGPVNFAGHYIVAEIGCGASCLLAAVIDATSGEVEWLPFSLCCWGLDVTAPISYRKDSDLLVLNGLRNESGKAATYFYRYTRQGFKELHQQVSNPGFDFPNLP